MKKILLLFFIVVMCGVGVDTYAYDYVKDGFPPILTSNQYSKIGEVEQSVFGQRYENQHIGARLNRLEKTLFNKTFPKLTYDSRIQKIILNYKNGSSFSGLSKIERQVFDMIYENETPETRISRIEQQVMGTVQQGDLLARYRNLQRVVPSYYSNRMARQYCGMPIVSSGGRWRGLAGSLGNFFNSLNGYPTGFTPPVYSPYDAYSPDFQQNIYSNRGWHYNNNSYGSGTGVHILD